MSRERCRPRSLSHASRSPRPRSAQDLPNRPMTMVVPFAAGGAVDVLARTLARAHRRNPRPADRDRERRRRRRHDRLEPRRQGRARRLPVRARQRRHPRAEPDALQAAAYNVAKDFEPVILVGETPLLLVTRKDFPANNLQEFIAYGKAHPGELQVRLGRRRLGDPSRLRAVQRRGRHRGHAHPLSRRRTGDAGPDRRADRLRLQHHHQRLSAGARPADQGAGAARAPSARRSCPTCHRAGAGHGRLRRRKLERGFLPKGTPEPIVRKLNAAMSEAMDIAGHRQAAARHRHRHPGRRTAAPRPMPRSFVEQEIKKYEGPIKASGIVIE